MRNILTKIIAPIFAVSGLLGLTGCEDITTGEGAGLLSIALEGAGRNNPHLNQNQRQFYRGTSELAGDFANRRTQREVAQAGNPGPTEVVVENNYQPPQTNNYNPPVAQAPVQPERPGFFRMKIYNGWIVYGKISCQGYFVATLYTNPHLNPEIQGDARCNRLRIFSADGKEDITGKLKVSEKVPYQSDEWVFEPN